MSTKTSKTERQNLSIKRRALAAMYYASGETLEQVGERLGINKARVWQIINGRPDADDVRRRNKLVRKKRRHARDEARKARARVEAKEEVARQAREILEEAEREAAEANEAVNHLNRAQEASDLQPQA